MGFAIVVLLVESQFPHPWGRLYWLVDRYSSNHALQTLTLRDTQVTDAGPKELAALEKLEALDLSNTKVTDAGLGVLTQVKGLQSLTLHNTKITDQGMTEVAKMKSLKRLYLGGTEISHTGLKELAGMKLKTLQVPTWVRHELGFKHYLAAIEPPTQPNMRDFFGFGPATASVLRTGSLWNSVNERQRKGKTDRALKYYLEAVEQPIYNLNLAGWQVTNSGLQELAEVTSLESLDLRATNITTAGLKHLAGLKNLELLDLRGTNVTDAGAQELRQVLPNCTILHTGRRSPFRSKFLGR